ncbi:Response regulator consisting of a CheY-like receiver domain and a winged-helix DNA-binding domain [Paramagnetospirillum magneticum AMB-1]|uniref:Response regulator consisting of a CheY-like receiver domain and a winged-helix DNA-binding domain n=2 Tax=Paramagnetospirillum magneticum TaxID=84159 RepID=Q2W3E2_PARM1|nr:Response regulator consisting of a CheY-like receiver domain and a winged-helix DNA-binding domain [Paramagnetospirillum magneticum AMB-1]
MSRAIPAMPLSPAPAAVDLSKVKTLVCEPSLPVRQGIRLALNNVGIRDITEANTFLAAHQACKEGDHDFLVLNQEIEANDSTFIMRELRSGALGRDPFILTVMLLSSREEPKVRSAIDCGPDDLLLIPFAPDQLMNRLRILVERRKPFVVTHDYIGPDRRAAPRPGATSATQFQVPNPVRARGTNLPRDRYDRQKQDSIVAISVERIKRLAATMDWECNALTVSAREGRMTVESTYRSLLKLEQVAGELSARVAKQLGHSTDTIDSLTEMCRRLKVTPNNVAFSDIETITQTSRRISGTYTSR